MLPPGIRAVAQQGIDRPEQVTNGGLGGTNLAATQASTRRIDPMNNSTGMDYATFQRWRRLFEWLFWPLLYASNAIFNSMTAAIDHPDLPAWQPWSWEWSSSLIMLALIPAVIVLERRWPLRFDSWRQTLLIHLLASVPFSLIHVLGMVGLRKLTYTLAGLQYGFGDWALNFGYEYLKDVRSYFSIIVILGLYRLWRMRLQGEARLLVEPDDGPPVEPVERPERFLVRKLGKEFLINASEIEWLQASGNYVNLHVRGRDYPLRTTMAAIEERLDTARFVRVHRSYFVNLDYLVQIESLETGDARLTLRDGATIPCSRSHRGSLRERFGS